ncbi:MAG TPA: hypothetical protein VLI04_17115 [Nocardioidaceae bacterium]|nr:hypothetical protein [Nocardioidaceae bacterium]
MDERPSPMQGAQSLVRGLFDIEEGLSRSLLTAIYRLVFLLAALPWIIFTVLAFQRSNVVWGLVWAVVLGPAVYVALVIASRFALGFTVMLIRLIQELTELPNAVDRLTSEVANLRGDIGRLPDVVEELTGQVQALPGVVGHLNEHIDSLQYSLDKAQFWRTSRRRPRSRTDEPLEPVPNEPEE